MDSNINKAIQILKKNNQEHIIPFLENGKNRILIEQILNIDFNELNKLYKKTCTKLEVKEGEILPICALNPNKISKEEQNKLKNKGIEVIKSNKYAVVTMAGGQGTRLRTQFAKRYICH